MLRRLAQAVALAALSIAAPVAQSPQANDLTEATRAFYQGDYDKSAELAANRAKANPKATEARILLGRAEMARGHLESAYVELREVLRLDPKNIDALYYLAKLSGALSQIQYQQLFLLAPDSARVHQLMAQIHLAEHNTAGAEKEFQAALQADPSLLAVLDALADLLRSQARYDEAVTYYSRAQEIAPRDYDSAYGLGACYLYQGKADQAIRQFRRALATDPDSPSGRLALGDSLLRAANPAAAITELNAALRRQPNNRQVYTLLGRAYQKLGQTRQAKEAFDKARELSEAEVKERQTIFSADELIPAPRPGGKL